MNAYLGMLGHCKTYKLRRKLLHNHLSPLWWQYVRETETGVIEVIKDESESQ